MKKTFKPGIFALLCILALSSCEEEEKLQITYPDTGFYGVNLLNTSDSTVTYMRGIPAESNFFYSLKASVPDFNYTVELHITGSKVGITSGQGWWVSSGNAYSETDTLILYAEGPVTADIGISFYDEGYASIAIFENNNEQASRIKTIKKERD